MKNKQISMLILCGLLIGCGHKQEKTNMTVDEAFGYITDSMRNNCNSNQDDKGEYCDYANNLYSDANNKVQNKVLQDPIIQSLLTKAQGVDCYHAYPAPAVCIAVDMRANEIEMKVVRELGISATTSIFDVGSSFIQGAFNQTARNQEATKLLREATESKNI